jgi:hypothetical protein
VDQIIIIIEIEFSRSPRRSHLIATIEKLARKHKIRQAKTRRVIYPGSAAVSEIWLPAMFRP